MELSYIRKHWINQMNVDSAASISAWDSVAEDYVYDGSVSLEKNSFLQFMQSKIELTADMQVLDVGCGAGAYSLALAPKVKKAVGTDFSPKMIKAAKRSATQLGIANAEFIERDWHNCDGEEFKRQYDVVFAHTTPAVVDYDSFMKMMEASKKYCFFCKPARRTDEVLDKLRSLVGMDYLQHDESVAYTFDTIWAYGFNPELNYEETVWKSGKSLDEAQVWYLGRRKGTGHLTPAQEEEICRYLESISENGQVTETTKTTLVNMFWEVT